MQLRSLRPNPHSLRWKIAALAATASAALALGVGVLVHNSTWDRAKAIARGQAVDELISATNTYERTGTPPPVAQLDFDGLPPALVEQARTQPYATAYAHPSAYRTWMWAAGPANGHLLSVQHDMTTDQLSLQALDRHMLYASLAALAVIIPTAALAAELPNRRLRRVAATARRISAGDLQARARPSGWSPPGPADTTRSTTSPRPSTTWPTRCTSVC